MKINSLIRVRFIDRDGDEFTILMEDITLIKVLDDK